MSANDFAIKVKSVSKSFRLPHEKQGSIKGAFVNIFKGKRTFEKQQVLRGVGFEIKQGEFFGIVGRNGSGKSTLLKLLAGIYAQDSGAIDIVGKLTPFIELGVGFNPELTGRENVYLNGALLGYSRKEMEAKYEDIVEFAELEKFMDQKLKNYSSGMQVRLAFSIAIQSKSDIYLFDEVLAVGDYAFQQKCYEYFKYLKSIKKTVILVSHDAGALQMFCTSGILLEGGKIVKQGKIQDVLKGYAKQTLERQEASQSKASQEPKGEVEGGKTVSVKRVYTESGPGNDKNNFRPHEKITITYEVVASRALDNPVIGLVFQDAAGGAPIFATNTLDMNINTGVFSPGEVRQIRFEIDNVFNDSKLYISGAVSSSDRSQVYVRFYNIHSFSTLGWTNTARGSVYLPHNIRVS